jgi:hypothetical protein
VSYHKNNHRPDAPWARILDFTEEDDESSTDYEEEYCSIFDDCTNQDEGEIIARHLSYDKDRLAALARLAVAFSPQQQCLSLRDIVSVEILSVNNDHIDISAVVCENDGCVTILVPVSFPNDCSTVSSSSMEECVIDNIDALDIRAQNIISRIESSNNMDLCTLDGCAELPSWWVQPEVKPALIHECVAIKKLLNENDFEDSIKELVNKSIATFMSGKKSIQILQAAVAAVGPAGLYIRARIKSGDSLDSDTLDETTIVDIPYSFGDSVKNAVDLRSAVLRTIA